MGSGCENPIAAEAFVRQTTPHFGGTSREVFYSVLAYHTPSGRKSKYLFEKYRYFFIETASLLCGRCFIRKSESNLLRRQSSKFALPVLQFPDPARRPLRRASAQADRPAVRPPAFQGVDLEENRAPVPPEKWALPPQAYWAVPPPVFGEGPLPA